MLSVPPNEPYGKLRKILRFTWIIPGIALLMTAGIFYSRWLENERIRDQAAKKKQAEERESARIAVENLGGSRFEVLHFYASPPVLRRGEAAQMCYGVANAKAVRIEPKPEHGVWPSLNRCFDVAPRAETTYTLTAEHADGRTVTATLTIKVQ
jgi:hypothetical protein